MSPDLARLAVTIVTGMSGAGRSAAANALEDLGFFVIDNLPPRLIAEVAALAGGNDQPPPYALVVDVRSGDFLADLESATDRLRGEGASVRTLFLDAADEVLVRRYEASRRRHPLSTSVRVADGIARERELLAPLRGEADLLVDTTNLNVHQLRSRLHELFAGTTEAPGLRVNVVSFGYKHGLPLDVDIVLDCRFLPNPHWIDELRPLTGLDPAVRDFVLVAADGFVERIGAVFEHTLPGYADEGKAYLSIGVGCTGGRHRSVAVAERLAATLRDLGADPVVHHRDIGRD
ncbi:MAG: RNase adapter RapZ [Actinomycetota bacterium]